MRHYFGNTLKITAALSLLTWAGCSGEIIEMVEKVGERVEVSCIARTSEPQGKSLFTLDEDSIGFISVWCYLDGKLDAEYYGDNYSCSLRLFEGKEYNIYALANTYRQYPPENESELESFIYYYQADSDDGLFPLGLPMSTPVAVSFTPKKNSSFLSLGLQRLVAKYRLRIAKPESTVGEMVLTSARIRNVASSVTPFGAFSSCDEVEDGDMYISESLANGDDAVFYIPENMNGGILNESSCTFIELKGHLSYEDRPSGNNVYVLGQDMTYKWFLRDMEEGDYNVVRNRSYEAEFSWTDFGWKVDSQHITVDGISEEGTYSLTFCDSEGVPVSHVDHKATEKGATVDIYYRIVPESSASQVSLTSNIPPERIMLTTTEQGVALGEGIFRTSFLNTAERAGTAEIIFTLTNASKAISCSATHRFEGEGKCVTDWEEDENEKVYF